MPRTFTKIDPNAFRKNIRMSRAVAVDDSFTPEEALTTVLLAETEAHQAAEYLAQLTLLAGDDKYDQREAAKQAVVEQTKKAKDHQARLKSLKGSLAPDQKKKATEAWKARKEELQAARITQLESELAAHMEFVEHAELYGKTEEEVIGHQKAISEIEAALKAAEG